jgi:hypothetical protein
VEARTGLFWLKIGAGAGRLWMQKWTFEFHKMWGFSWLPDGLLASQEWLSSVRLIRSLSQISEWHFCNNNVHFNGLSATMIILTIWTWSWTCKF